MAKGIIIFGAAGSGKTTLGRRLAERLGYPYFDLDDYIWRKDTAEPFTVMYSREEKIGRLMNDLSGHEHFVMGGSMSSFHEHFDPMFELGVHLTADTALRLERVHRRELELFGERILEGGDMYENHQRFLDNTARYDTDGSPSMADHSRWGEIMPCEVIRLDGADDIDANVDRILEAYADSKHKN